MKDAFKISSSLYACYCIYCEFEMNREIVASYWSKGSQRWVSVCPPCHKKRMYHWQHQQWVKIFEAKTASQKRAE